MTTLHPAQAHRRVLNQPWQVPVDPSTSVTLPTVDPFGHHRIDRATVFCPVSNRREGTVRMEGQVCSFCARPTT
jgi:hypothetical protein